MLPTCLFFVHVLIFRHVGPTETTVSPAARKTNPVSSSPSSLAPSKANATCTSSYMKVKTTDLNVTPTAVNVTSKYQITDIQTPTLATQNGMSQVTVVCDT